MDLNSWSTEAEREALRERRRSEFRPLDLSPREIVVLGHILDLAETAIAGAKLRDLPK